MCGGTTCTTQADVDRANELAGGARTKATVSTALFIGGGLLAATGVVLWITAPSETTIAPHASENGADVVLSGRF